MRINNNIMAMNTHRQYTINTNSVAKSTEKLSSGYRINRAGDDAAGLAISEKMRAQIRGLTMASKNSQDAISLVQTAEGALQETHNILQRMRELAVQSSSDTNETSIDRDALNKEFKALIAEIDDTASKTKFNDMGLIDGSYASNITAASTANTKIAGVWASTSVEAGTYTVSANTITLREAVADVAGTFDGSSLGVTGGAFTIAFTAGAGKNEKLNGDWKISLTSDPSGNSVATLTNTTTNEKRTATIGAGNIASAATKELDFGPDLGKITLTATAATNLSDITAFSGNVNVVDSMSAKAAVTADTLSMNGEEVVLKDGMSTIVFANSDISVKLGAAYSKGTTDVSADYDATDIVVTKDSRNPFVVQTGSNQGDELAISIEKMDAGTLGVRTAAISNRLDASAAITQVNTAINAVSTQRAALGALQNRLNHKINNLDTSAENLSAAESRIRDLDMAKEMTNFTRNNILVQASTAMLAQANAAPQGVLQLLQ